MMTSFSTGGVLKLGPVELGPTFSVATGIGDLALLKPTTESRNGRLSLFFEEVELVGQSWTCRLQFNQDGILLIAFLGLKIGGHGARWEDWNDMKEQTRATETAKLISTLLGMNVGVGQTVKLSWGEVRVEPVEGQSGGGVAIRYRR